MIDIEIRFMIRKDVDKLLQIESQSNKDPWGADDFCKTMKEINSIGMSVEAGGRIVGFFVYKLYPRFFEVTKLAIDSDFRRRGIASRLLSKLQHKLELTERNMVLFTVPDYCLDMHLFLKSRGFRCVAVNGDKYVMKYFVTKPSGVLS